MTDDSEIELPEIPLGDGDFELIHLVVADCMVAFSSEYIKSISDKLVTDAAANNSTPQEIAAIVIASLGHQLARSRALAPSENGKVVLN